MTPTTQLGAAIGFAVGFLLWYAVGWPAQIPATVLGFYIGRHLSRRREAWRGVMPDMSSSRDEHERLGERPVIRW
jgi:hypothetical protein